ncbi:MAG: FAD-dependent oxidoreductase [Bacteroidota bacterium]|nr:FAD-dependent oxidoreductase [Bacteroidota bacterium]MDP4212420.1 FAD-dependent oxidoreductase [Bacteroidota bacterium]MDP4251256.1 FAD-dependent oxidoreductase [Bacteroidota bacterium]
MLPITIWESESFFSPRDYIIIGSGFTGLWSAYYLKKRHPDRSVMILERGTIPGGASTRNAGFACFGSFTELMADIKQMGSKEMLELVDMRFRGLKKIRSLFGKQRIDYESTGGYELISREQYPDINVLRTQIDQLNQQLKKITGKQKTFQLSDSKIKQFGLGGSGHLIENSLEGQLHSGKLCAALLQKVQSMGVTLLTNTEIQKLEINANAVELQTNLPVTLKAGKVLICTNAFAKTLLPDLDIKPARGQILLTSPIKGLKIIGGFHYEEGFYYFRNLGSRVLLGGARNKFLKEEETFSAITSSPVQENLEKFLKEIVLPGVQYTIDQRWAGIMAVGEEKKPIIKKVNDRVYCAVRLSGMGVALAPQIAKMVAGMM